MRSTRDLVVAASLALMTLPASAQVSLFPIPREPQQKLSFAWSGPLKGAVQALAARLGYTAWTTMASGLPIPGPPSSVDVRIDVNGVAAADVVVLMNRQAEHRAVVVLDPAKRFIQVVYYD